jgi:hypothetical protein
MICAAAEVTFTLREFQDNESDACAAILDALPEWFGIAEVNAGYVAGITAETAFVVSGGDQEVAGFVGLRVHDPLGESLAARGRMTRRWYS